MHIYDKPDLPTVLVDHLLIMKKDTKIQRNWTFTIYLSKQTR